jgi:large repetitive protein
MPNTVPTLHDFAAAITLAENTVNAAPQLLDADVTFTDPDDNFDGGTLVVSGLLAEDRVSIRDQGAGAGQIQFDSGTGAVSFGGTQIGTAVGGAGGAFTVTFNAGATSPAIEALIENLTYANVSDTPTASRTLTVEVTDAAGAGTRGASHGFTQHPSNPLAGIDVGSNSAPAFGDLDGDGDLDIVLGNNYGQLFTITNTGTVPTPVFGAPVQIGGIDVGTNSSPALGDLDGDGDLDIVVGDDLGQLFTITNTGTAAAPAFASPVQIAGVDVGQ